MSKWKCEICNTEFENFEARGFNNIIYCPLCYYKKLYNQQKEVLDKIKKELEEPDIYGVDEDGYDDAYYDKIYVRRIEELLEEIE